MTKGAVVQQNAVMPSSRISSPECRGQTPVVAGRPACTPAAVEDNVFATIPSHLSSATSEESLGPCWAPLVGGQPHCPSCLLRVFPSSSSVSMYTCPTCLREFSGPLVSPSTCGRLELNVSPSALSSTSSVESESDISLLDASSPLPLQMREHYVHPIAVDGMSSRSNSAWTVALDTATNANTSPALLPTQATVFDFSSTANRLTLDLSAALPSVPRLPKRDQEVMDEIAESEMSQVQWDFSSFCSTGACPAPPSSPVGDVRQEFAPFSFRRRIRSGEKENTSSPVNSNRRRVLCHSHSHPGRPAGKSAARILKRRSATHGHLRFLSEGTLLQVATNLATTYKEQARHNVELKRSVMSFSSRQQRCEEPDSDGEL